MSWSLGGGMGGVRPFAALEEVTKHLEEGERASFTFAAEGKRLPLDEPPWAAQVVEGDTVEIDATLESLLKQADVSRNKDLSVTKCKLAPGKGFWRPRPLYRVTVSAAPAPASPKGSKGSEGRPPKGVGQYTFTLGDDATAAPALQDAVYSMTIGEVALVTAPRPRFVPWPAGGALSEGGIDGLATSQAEADGTATLWLRLDAMTRLEDFAKGGARPAPPSPALHRRRRPRRRLPPFAAVCRPCCPGRRGYRLPTIAWRAASKRICNAPPLSRAPPARRPSAARPTQD